MRTKLEKYVKGEINYTPIMNIFINNRTKDWYAELGKYIDETIDIDQVPDFAFYSKHRPKNNIATKIKGFLGDGNRFYFGIASMFVTSTLDENALKKMFGEPILHSEFGEGFDGEYDEETDDFLEPGIKESYASYFVNVGGSDFHIGYDHRGTRIEIGLSKPFSYERKPSDQLAESCLQSLKDLFDLYKKKCL